MRSPRRIGFIWLGIFLAVHLAGMLGLWGYHLRTGLFAGIGIQSAAPVEVFMITPTGHRESVGVAGEKNLVISRRPLKSLEIVLADRIVTIDRETFPQSSALLNKSGIRVNVDHDTKSIFATAGWILQDKAVMAGLLGFYFLSLGSLLLLRRKTLLKNAGRRKIRLFRFLVKGHGFHFDITGDPLKPKGYQHFLMILVLVCALLQIFNLPADRPLSHTSLESRRALVAMEMKLSGNYTAPTLCGEPYLNKFPLGHWVFVPWVDSAGNPEGRLRSVASFFILLSSLVLFFFIKRIRQSYGLALMTALSFLCSMMVLNFKVIKLDQFFTFLCLLLFFVNYAFAEKKQYLALFVSGYLIAFLGFLTKGLLMLYFQGWSLLILFLVNRNLKQLFSWKHLAGLGLFAGLCVGYFILYARYYDPLAYLKNQVFQMDHTSDFSFVYRLKFFLGFWGTNMIQYAPMMVLLPLLFLRGHLVRVLRDRFASYLMLLSFAGISVFWLSPEYLPYYILMFVPLLMFLLVQLCFSISPDSSKAKWAIVLPVAVLLMLALIYPSFDFDLKVLYLLPFIVLPVLVLMLPVRFRLNLLLVTFFLLIAGSFISEKMLPEKQDRRETEKLAKESAARIIREHPQERLLLFSKETGIQDAVAFYLEYYSNRILRVADPSALNRNSLLLANKDQLPPSCTLLDSIPQYVFVNEADDRRVYTLSKPLYLIRLKTTEQ